MLPQSTLRQHPPRTTVPCRFRRCAHCGHVSEDVIEQPDYVGGRGDVTSHKCRDALACWHRWDRQNGLVS